MNKFQPNQWKNETDSDSVSTCCFSYYHFKLKLNFNASNFVEWMFLILKMLDLCKHMRSIMYTDFYVCFCSLRTSTKESILNDYGEINLYYRKEDISDSFITFLSMNLCFFPWFLYIWEFYAIHSQLASIPKGYWS